MALGFRRARPRVRAHGIVMLERRAEPGMLQRQLHANRLHGPVVGPQQRQAVGADPPAPAYALHGIARLGGIAAVVAHAAVGGGRRILRLRGAVGEQHQAVPRGGLAVLLQPPPQAFLGQQALHERGVALAVLYAVAARARLRQERPNLIGQPPGRQRRVAGKHRLHDLHHAAILEHPAVAALPQQPGPRHQLQPVTRQAAVGAQARGLPHQPAARGHPAIGEAGLQGGRCAQPIANGQPRVGGQHVHHPLTAV